MRTSLRQWLRDLAGLDDPPHKIAIGLALGIFVGFLPIMGIQMAVVLPFALLFRGNKTAAIGGVWITNPITVIPIYYANYKIGLLFSRFPSVTHGDFVELFNKMSLSKFLKLGEAVLIPMMVGGLVLAVLTSIPTYFISRRLIVRYRKKNDATVSD